MDIHQILTSTTTVAALLLFFSALCQFGVHIERMRQLASSRDERPPASNVHDRYSFARLGK